MKPTPLRAIHAFVLLLGVSLAGCYGPPEFVGFNPDEEEHFKNHRLILHPPVYEWNNTNKEFSGHVILTNRFPDPADEDKWINLPNMNINVGYWSNNGYVRKGDGGIASWPLDYDSFQRLVIKPGESMIFNFSFPPYNNHRDESVDVPVDRIELTIPYHYQYVNNTHIRGGSNPKGYFTHDIYYRNDCIFIVNGNIQQIVDDSEGCDPWGGRAVKSFHLGMEYRFDDFPPPEYWAEWTDDSPIPLWHHPWFRDDVEFLRDFKLEEANVVYFNGEIDY